MSELEADFIAGLEKLAKELPVNNPTEPPRKEVNITTQDILTMILTHSK